MSNQRLMTCPFCGFDKCEADWVDIGIGMEKCGPFHCSNCGAVEMGSGEIDKSKLSAEELDVGWYRCIDERYKDAPTVGGTLVGDHQVARRLYAMGLLDGPKPPGGGWRIVADEETRASLDKAVDDWSRAEELVSGVTATDLCTYLTKTGWTQKPNRAAAIFTIYDVDEDEPVDVEFPCSTTPHFRHEALRVVSALAIIERRNIVAVATDVRAVMTEIIASTAI